MGGLTKTRNKLNIIEVIKEVFGSNEDNVVNVLDEIPEWKELIKQKSILSEEELNNIEEINKVEADIKQRKISMSHNKNKNVNTKDTVEEKKRREEIKVINNEDKLIEKTK